MDAIEIILTILSILITLSAIFYHIYSYNKAKKVNEDEATQIVKFPEEKYMNSSERILFHFEEVNKKNKARRQFQISGSIRLAADLGFDYDSFVVAKSKEFSHSLFSEDIGIK